MTQRTITKDELLRILDRCPDLPDDWDAYNKDATAPRSC